MGQRSPKGQTADEGLRAYLPTDWRNPEPVPALERQE